MLTDIQAVLFDMDGTLIDSMGIWREIDIIYLKKHGFTLPADLQKAIAGMSFIQTAEYFKKRFCLKDSLETIMSDWNSMAYDKYVSDVPLKPGACAFLKNLRKQGIKTAICTSNSHILTDAVLNARGISRDIDLVLTAKEVPNGKPAPDIYETASRMLLVEAEHCLVFEDVSMGVLAGKNAGMKVCAVADRHCLDTPDEVKHFADYYIEDYEQITNKTYEVLHYE